MRARCRPWMSDFVTIVMKGRGQLRQRTHRITEWSAFRSMTRRTGIEKYSVSEPNQRKRIRQTCGKSIDVFALEKKKTPEKRRQHARIFVNMSGRSVRTHVRRRVKQCNKSRASSVCLIGWKSLSYLTSVSIPFQETKIVWGTKKMHCSFYVRSSSNRMRAEFT